MNTRNDIVELVLVLVAALSPMWLMAGDWSDLDEVMKSGVGVGCTAAVVALYRLWKTKHDRHRGATGQEGDG